MDRPVLVYDGNCKLCQQWVHRMEVLLGPCFEKISFHSDGFFENYPQVSKEECEKAVQLLMPDGKKYSAVEAFVRLLWLRPWFRVCAWLYYVPGIRQLVEYVYQRVGRNRYRTEAFKW